MGKLTGFLDYARKPFDRRPVVERILDYKEVDRLLSEPELKAQGARCMDCGIPFCQSGCPLDNIIPDWNDLVYRGSWREAYERLIATNNFPEFTGRLCPAPCESSCVLGIIDDPVAIEQIEQAIIERAFEEGWVDAGKPVSRSLRTVAVVGSGPSGLAAADQLNRTGHNVTVLERHDRIGGLLRYGIPDFKLEKRILDRRLDLMASAGVRFETGVNVGVDLTAAELLEFDAAVLAGGATQPRDLPVTGRDLEGIHFAWDYLQQQNRRVAGESPINGQTPGREIHAGGKHVIVIGGGDTGSDCVGTANRQGAASVTQFELLPVPPTSRPEHQPWPTMPMVLKTTSSHEEGADRHWGILTTEFVGDGGSGARPACVTELRTVDIEQNDARGFERIEGTERSWPADLVLLAIGYVGPQHPGLLDDLGIDMGPRGTVATDDTYQTSIPGVFSAGDMRRGQSLIVWAIREGRDAVRGVNAYLKDL